MGAPPILVTGGAGFIGSALVRRLAGDGRGVVVVDKLTYAGTLESLAPIAGEPGYVFEHVDICDAEALGDVFARHGPAAVVHLAAESHVDRSIVGPAAFVRSNVVGTFTMLEAAKGFLATLPAAERDRFRFLHASTDEVYGSLREDGRFTEKAAYDPRSPYAASKAGSDHLARAWHHTYGLPVIVTNGSNNFGPYQFPEKLVPLMILNALERRSLPVYGRGENVRDWLYVDDHIDGLLAALERGRPGETYLFGGAGERRNLDVVRAICRLVDELAADAGAPREKLISFVEDRPGHDFRYAIDAAKAQHELGWRPRHGFEQALRATVRWYLENGEWWGRAVARGAGPGRIGLG